MHKTRSSAAARAGHGAAEVRLAARLLQPALLVAALTLLALGLRVYRLDYRDYWDDEVISTLAARPPVATILGSIGDYSVHPPLYYILLHVWARFVGEGLTALRMLSVLLSAACVPLTYLLGKRLASAPVGLLAAGLLAISPFQIYHAQQARMYPLLALLSLLATLAFLSAWLRGGYWRWWLLALCVAAGLYTHIYFAFSLLALNLWAAWEALRVNKLERTRWAGLLAAQATGCLLFLPFVPQLAGTVGGVVQWYWVTPAGPAAILGLPILISNGAGLLLFSRDGRMAGSEVAVIVAVVVMVLANIYAIRAARRSVPNGPGWSLLLLLLWVPPLAAGLISLTVRPILLDRSLIAVTAPTYLMVAWALVELRRSPLALAACGAFALSMVIVLAGVHASPAKPNSLRALASMLAQRQQPGDAIAFADWQSFDTAYLTQPGLKDVHVLPSQADSRVQFTGLAEWEGRLRYIGWPHLDRVAPVSAFASGYRRVWLTLTMYNPSVDYQLETNKAWLDANGRLVETIKGRRSVTWLYEIP